MLRVVGDILKKIIPRQYRPYGIVGHTIKKITGNTVYSGPFSGMKYPNIEYIPLSYLLGTYELELHPMIERLCQIPFDIIVNVGAAMGYYTVGFAIRNPNARVIAFESIPQDKDRIRQMSEINGVKKRLTILGHCDSNLLSDALSNSGKYLVFMDAEGDEGHLLNPYIIPKLRECYMLVELHKKKNTAEIISKSFRDSHKITEIWSRGRTLADYPMALPRHTVFVLKKYFIRSIQDGRPGKMRWFFLEPNIK